MNRKQTVLFATYLLLWTRSILGAASDDVLTSNRASVEGYYYDAFVKIAKGSQHVILRAFDGAKSKVALEEREVQLKLTDTESISRLTLAPWTTVGLYLFVTVTNNQAASGPKQFRYVGVACKGRQAGGWLDLTDMQVGSIFVSKVNYNWILVNNVGGDSLCVVFARVTNDKFGGFQFHEGVMWLDGCPVIPGPANLFILSGEELFNANRRLFEHGNDRSVIPMVGSGSSKSE